jgi:hypothetical protein
VICGSDDFGRGRSVIALNLRGSDVTVEEFQNYKSDCLRNET